MTDLSNGGERLVQPDLHRMKPNHVHRYDYAIQIIDRLFNGRAVRVLDAAAGTGYGGFMLAEAGHLVTSVERDAAVSEYGEQHYFHANLRREVADLNDYLPEEYDVVVSIETVEHLEDDTGLLQKFRAAPYLIATVPNQEVVPFDAKVHRFHYRHYTPVEFGALLASTGWEVMEWATQYDKVPGLVYPGKDGMGLLVVARRA